MTTRHLRVFETVAVDFKKNLKIITKLLLLIGILLFLFFRSPCKILEPYDNPFCGFEQRYIFEAGMCSFEAGM